MPPTYITYNDILVIESQQYLHLHTGAWMLEKSLNKQSMGILTQSLPVEDNVDADHRRIPRNEGSIQLQTASDQSRQNIFLESDCLGDRF